MSAPQSPLDDSPDTLSPPLPDSTDDSLSTPSDSLPPPSPALEPPPATESESFSPPPPSPIEPPPADSSPPPSQPPPSDSFTPTDNKEEPPEEDSPSPPTPSEPPPPPTSFEQDPTDPPPPPDESGQGSDDSLPTPTPSDQQQADPPPPPNASDEQQSADPPPPSARLKGRPSDEQQSADPPPPSNSSSKEKKQQKHKPVTPSASFEPPPGGSESPPTPDTSPPFNSALPPTPSVRSKDDSSSVQPPSSLPSSDSPFSNQNSTSAPRSSFSQSPPSLMPSRPAAEQNGWQPLAPPPPLGQTSPDPAFLQLGVIVIVLGGILTLAVFGLCLICCSRRKKKDPYGTEGYYMQQPHPGKDGNRSSSQMQNYQHGPPSAEQYQMAKSPPRSSMGSRRGNSTLHKNYSDKSFNPSSMGLNLSLSTTAFSYEELAMATNGFSSENFLGQGGFGYVHKGILPNGKEVAVKSLKADSGQGDREFQVEIDVISRVHHKHLVCLVGYCVTDNQRMLVYEFIGNGTLEFHLHGKGRTTMDWSTRMKIALGSAKGLAYLHEDCHPKIIHRDIKGANILIDLDYEAKVADFGLAKLTTDNNTHVSTRVMGTFGYLAPEYASTGKLSEKSDVFSFGVMLLELITGRRPVNRKDTEDSLVDWARPLLAKALEDGNLDPLVDPKLGNNYNMHEMASMVACAAGAVSHSFKRRPRMSQIVRALDESSSFTDLNGGEIPGQTKIFGSPDYTSEQYKEDMKKFKQMILDSQGNSEHTAGGETTSEYSVTSDSTTFESQTSPETDGRR